MQQWHNCSYFITCTCLHQFKKKSLVIRYYGGVNIQVNTKLLKKNANEGINLWKYLNKINVTWNWVFDTNSDVPILISLQPDVVYLRYFKLWILSD